MLVDSLPKAKNEENFLMKHGVQRIFFKTNWIKLVSNKAWLKETLDIYLKEQLLINSMLKYLIIIKMQNMIDIKEV